MPRSSMKKFVNPISLVCSGLSAENVQVVQEFANKFGAKFSRNFTLDVTHVIVHTDPELKCGQKTSKYILGIGFKKYVVSFEWIVDCLKQDQLLDEDDEKYAVLDPDTLENGAKRSREGIANIFDGFAVCCLKPLSFLSLEELKKLLHFNGANLTNSTELSTYKDKHKLIILDPENSLEHERNPVKTLDGILVSFEWVIDCISQYSITSIAPYLYKTTIEEALELKIPQELLVIAKPLEKANMLRGSRSMFTKNPLKRSYSRELSLVCSGLSTGNIKVVHEFAKKFRAKLKSDFALDVTHVIMHTDPELKFGQKTSKYIQGVGFKKYVVSFEWIVDCLEQNQLLDEYDEKYVVLDSDTLENGAKKSRERIANIFEGFAVYCVEPFSALPLEDFKNLLRFNGAVVTKSPKEFPFYKDKHKFVIFESEDLEEQEINLLKSSRGVLVSFEWVIDSVSQYTLTSLAPYLYETSKTSIKEALALGIPQELLDIEELVEEDY